jgi:opacity protein-like surface antigen
MEGTNDVRTLKAIRSDFEDITIMAIQSFRIAGLGAMVSAVCAFVPPSASADGYQRRTVYAAPTLSSWTGLYMGIHAGGAWSQVNWADVDLTGEPVNNDAIGFIGGAQVGYNVQLGSLVVGAEATISGTTLRDDFRSVVNPAAVTYTTDIQAITTVTGRLGIATNQLLIYAKAGWAGANVDVSGRNIAPPDSFAFSDWRNGWTAGGGGELRLSPTMSFGVEYSYIDLGSRNYAGTTVFPFPVAITDHDVQIHSVTARLNFKLYRDEYVPMK